MHQRIDTQGTIGKLGHVAGMTLIELMVALAIGGFLMIGAVTVFMQSRTTFRISESVSRMQESSRFVLDRLEPDIRMAHYWGLTTRTNKILGRASPADPNGIGPDDCGVNWTIDLDNEIEGTNNGYAWGCPGSPTVAPNADTLVVRRVSEDPMAVLAGNVMYLQSARFQDSQLFQGAAVPPGYAAATSQTHQLVVNGYYVSQNSTLDTPGNPIPSLRMQTLVPGPAIQNQEVLPGVEDMQIQFGVDTDVVGGADRGSVDRYVNPGDPIINPANPAFIPFAEILSVRIWLRIRAERAENGFTDTTNYVYADQNVGPFGDGFRRIVVSKTIYLRNARPPT
ncbi:MAG TPA: PilW family protein [Gammaproteobacteria bacterium]|nr:PilW family protein [Gammaproteobacteria bacterium]